MYIYIYIYPTTRRRVTTPIPFVLLRTGFDSDFDSIRVSIRLEFRFGSISDSIRVPTRFDFHSIRNLIWFSI